jgi:hypothetical protein
LFYQNLYQSLKLKALFGMVECDGVEWNGIKSCSIVWICKKWMEWYIWNTIESIPSHTTIFFNISFPTIWSVFNGIGSSNEIITFLSLFFYLITLNHLFFSFLSVWSYVSPSIFSSCYTFVHVTQVNLFLFTCGCVIVIVIVIDSYSYL